MQSVCKYNRFFANDGNDRNETRNTDFNNGFDIILFGTFRAGKDGHHMPAATRWNDIQRQDKRRRVHEDNDHCTRSRHNPGQ